MATVNNATLNNALTQYARGKKFAGHIADNIFVRETSPSLTGRYWDFSSGDYQSEGQAGPLALDQEYPRLEWDVATGTFTIENRGLEVGISDVEYTNADSALRLEQKKMRRMRRWLLTLKESLAKDALYQTGANGFSGDNLVNLNAKKWSDDANDPAKDVQSAKAVIQSAIGVEGNAIVIPYNVLTALRQNAKLLERHRYQSEAQITLANLSAQFEIPVENIFIGQAVYNTAKRGQTQKLGNIWSDHCVLFYREAQAEGMPPEDAGFAAEFRLSGYEDLRINEGRTLNPPGRLFVGQDLYVQQVMDYTAGVLLQNAV